MNFIIVNVQKPIIGADFLRYFGLLVDIKQHQLIDVTTCWHIQDIFLPTPHWPYNTLRSEFTALTQVSNLIHLLSMI